MAALQLDGLGWTSNEVLAILKELLLNFVGSTSFEFYVFDSTGTELKSVGMQSFRGRPPSGNAVGRISEALAKREAKSFSDAPFAVTPVMIGSRPVGALVIAELLKHKTELGPGDMEIFDLLSEQLGPVLFRACRLEKAGLNAPDTHASLSELVNP